MVGIKPPKSQEVDDVTREMSQWVVGALDQLKAALNSGDIQEISVANDRIEKYSSSMKNYLRRSAQFNEV
jgi:hypothetical protein